MGEGIDLFQLVQFMAARLQRDEQATQEVEGCSDQKHFSPSGSGETERQEGVNNKSTTPSLPYLLPPALFSKAGVLNL